MGMLDWSLPKIENVGVKKLNLWGEESKIFNLNIDVDKKKVFTFFTFYKMPFDIQITMSNMTAGR